MVDSLSRNSFIDNSSYIKSPERKETRPSTLITLARSFKERVMVLLSRLSSMLFTRHNDVLDNVFKIDCKGSRLEIGDWLYDKQVIALSLEKIPFLDNRIVADKAKRHIAILEHIIKTTWNDIMSIDEDFADSNNPIRAKWMENCSEALKLIKNHVIDIEFKHRYNKDREGNDIEPISFKSYIREKEKELKTTLDRLYVSISNPLRDSDNIKEESGF